MKAQKEFLKGAKLLMKQLLLILVIMIIKLQPCKPLLNKDIFNQFDDALKEKSKEGSFCRNNIYWC